MSTYRCTQCGCRIDAAAGVKISTCPACQALFVLPNQFEKKENLYLLASDARHAGNYDAALNYYGRILKVDGAEPEANWGYLLSKYGVEISENALDYGGVIFHRAEHGSLTEDPAFEKMMSYLPKESKYYYETIARRIETQHKKLMEISRNLTVPDIFIDCTAAPNTEDFLLSVQIGKALEDAGYRIFHPGMLSGVPRADLNLYEMAAAEKAEAMIVTATRGTNWADARFGAVWKRFYAYRRKDAGRKMLSVFRGIRPEDLPGELQQLQSIACEGSDFQKRVVEDINRMFGRRNRSADLVRENLELLRDGWQALEQARYEQAEKLFRKAAENDGEEYRAHFGIVCALTENLRKPLLSDEADNHYRLALQFADKATAEEYTKRMTALMQDEAWKAFLLATDQLRNHYGEQSGNVLKAEERIKLYLPAFDGRFGQVERWHLECSRQRELDAVRQAYKNRDTAVEPLFAEQEKVEYAYENTAFGMPRRMENSKWRALVLELSLVLMAASYMLILQNFRFTTGYTTGYYKFSVFLFIASLACIGFWVWTLLPEKAVFWVGAIAVLALYRVSRVHIRQYQLYLMLLPIVLLLVERLMMAVYAKNRRESWKTKQKAGEAVLEVGDRLEASYRAAMERVFAKYRLPKEEVPKLDIPHSGYFRGFDRLETPAPAFTYLLPAVICPIACLLAVTLLSNGIYASGWNDIVKVDCGYFHVVGLREDGTVKANGRNQMGQCNVSGWENVTDIAAGMTYSAGLTEDGRVLIACGEEDPLKEAESWTDIKAISAGANHIAGLKNDGTVVAAGANTYGENDTQEWTDIVQLQAGSNPDKAAFTYGVRADGSICMTGDVAYNNDYGQIKEIVAEQFGPGEGQSQAETLYGDSESILVRTTDGKLHGIGSDGFSQLSQAQEWDGNEFSDIRVSAISDTVGLKKDGTVAVAGNETSIRNGASGWTDITAIDLDGTTCVGLKSDGTVVAAGSNSLKQLETGGFKDVVSVEASYHASFGVRANGRVDAAGYSYAGMTYVNPKNPLELLAFWQQALRW